MARLCRPKKLKGRRPGCSSALARGLLSSRLHKKYPAQNRKNQGSRGK